MWVDAVLGIGWIAGTQLKDKTTANICLFMCGFWSMACLAKYHLIATITRKNQLINQYIRIVNQYESMIAQRLDAAADQHAA